MRVKAKKEDHFPIGKFFLWKSRDVSLAAVNTIILGYLTIYCTNALGMKAALVGTLLMVSKVFDGVTDLFSGFLVDNTRTRLGKARPYEISIVGVWICTLLLFSCSPAWSDTLKAVWIFVMYTFTFSIFNTLLTANQTPYMIRAFSNNRQMITKVSSFGGIVSMIGGIVISVSFPLLMAKLATGAAGWKTLIMIYALPLCAIGVLRFIFVREDPTVDEGNPDRVSFKDVLRMLKSNKYCWIGAGIMLFYQMAVGFGAGTYYFTYIIGDISKFSLVSVLSVVLLPVMFVFPALMKKMNVARLFEIFAAIAVAGYLIIFVGNQNFPVVLTGLLLVALLNMPLGYLGALVIMQLATYNEYQNLPRMEGSCGIVSNFASKVGGGIGAGISMIMLGASGFVSSTTGNIVQPAGALLMIRCLYSLIPAVCAVCIILLSVQLGRLCRSVPQMEQEIRDRKEAEALEEEPIDA